MRKVMNDALKGILILFAIAFLWGTSFPVIKIVVNDQSPFIYTGFRALFSSTVLVPILIFDIAKNGLDKNSIKAGILTGIMYSLGIFFQGWGTQYTSASNSAFLTSTSVIIVLVIETFLKKKFSKEVALAGLGAVIGVYLLTDTSGDLTTGDLLVLVSALFWSLQILFISYLKFDNYNQFVSVMLLFPLVFLLSLLRKDYSASLALSSVIWLAYLGIVVGVLSSYGQVVGQRKVSASISAIIYQMEPLFAYALSYLFLGESYSLKKGLGAIIIFMSCLYASYYKVKKESQV
ncbi:MAG: DMT family transporter [Fervidicoccaceae archaeon]